ncbi:GGDEF domain-containing protein [Viridibacillus sp. YIM B01967]|uniref:GGDEF domain-containing protein n=1 Tax=Viridibacillus soli TaxID=2798301 RepID=A0ABS1H7G6_9BACL|nr:bifunctional diguanylate cyclase/phosphodiesterase [Viridibacillus soli]MBK3495368.1 GGDEF domain-containing protein [Viridibacillus soli]
MYNSSLSPQQFLGFVQKLVRLYPESMTILIEQDSQKQYWITYANESFKTFFDTSFEQNALASTFFTHQIGTELEEILLQSNEEIEQNVKQLTFIRNAKQHTVDVGVFSVPAVQHKLICLSFTKIVSEVPYCALMDHNLDPVITIDRNGYIVNSNKSATAVYGYKQDALLQMTLLEIVSKHAIQDMKQLIEKTIEKRQPQELSECNIKNVEEKTLRAYVKSIPVIENNEVKEIQIILRDITAYGETGKTVFYLSYHDQLTGIWNKRALNEHFKEEESSAKRRGNQMAIILLDLDRFKKINDSIGLNKGDELLRKIAQRLSTLTEPNCHMYRQNGDDFIFLIQQADVTITECFAHKILTLLKQPYSIDEQELNISGSIGISMYPDDGVELDTLVQKADQALYYVKERGRAGYRFYHKKMLDTSRTEAVMESHLRRAIEKKELSIHYQPQVDLDTGNINSFEALLRWNNPKFGFVAPGVFIPIAEDSGLILEIGDWVLDQVCIQLKEWQNGGFLDARIAVNISSKQFKQEAFASAIKKYIYKYELNPQALELEITESSMTNIHETLSILKELKQMGVIISIDDFGTGYSSLSYLRRYPIDIIKIDQSFIKEIEQDEKDEAIAKTIIHLAHSLGMEVIAEGVEKKDHVEILKAVNCEKGQGYYFSRPVPIENIIEMYFC